MAGRSGTLSRGRELKIKTFQERMDEILDREGLDVDPILVLAELAAGKKKNKKGEYVDAYGGFDEEGNPVILDANVRQKAAAELCSYLYPKRKAVEISGQVDTPIQFVVVPDMSELPVMPGDKILDMPAEPVQLPPATNQDLLALEPKPEE